MRKMPVSKFTSRPRFEPVHFVSGGSSGSGIGIGETDEKENEKERRRCEMNDIRQREPDHPPNGNRGNGSSGSLETGRYGYDSWPEHRSKDVASGSTSGLGYGSRGSTPNFMGKMQQEYTARYEAHTARQSDSYSKAGQAGGYGGSGAWDSGRRGLGFGHQDRQTSSKAFSRVYDGPSRGGCGLLPTPSLQSSIPASTIDEKTEADYQSIIGRCRYPERSCCSWVDPTRQTTISYSVAAFRLARQTQSISMLI